MSVHQLKDGRWIVQYRDKSKKSGYSREYFGRGLEGEKKARLRNKALSLNSYIRKNDSSKNQSMPNSKTSKESQVAGKLYSKLAEWYDEEKVESQVTIKSGRIDILTPDEIIEVKNVRSWKKAIGQLFVYSKYFPEKHLRIHLFGKSNAIILEKIIKSCHYLKISVTHHNADKFLPSNIRSKSKLRLKRFQNEPDIEKLRELVNKLPALEIPNQFGN